jgi:catechol 2,3-dioxygenase-like lactoylglutathione lyase family enzyme
MSELSHSLLILPVPDLIRTADFYEKKLKFKVVKYLDVQQPHVCLYRDFIEIVLTKSKLFEIKPNRTVHGYGYDGYFTGKEIEEIYQECIKNDVKIVQHLHMTDYNNLEFVLEDIDKRWICIGIKKE